MEGPPAKKVRSTNAQIRYLIDFMATNSDLVFEKNFSSSPHSAQKRLHKWLKLKLALKEYGPDRSIDKWKSTWRDIKRHARTEQCKFANGEVDRLTPQAEAVSEIFRKIKENPCDNENNEDSELETIDTTADISWNKSLRVTAGNTYEEPENITKEDPLVLVEADEGETKQGGTFSLTEFLNEEPESPKEQEKRPRRRKSSSSSSNSVYKPKKSKRNDNMNNFCNSSNDHSLLSTFNKFIEYEKEKEKLNHEREMSKIAQNDTLLKLLGRMVRVVEDLAPCIKKCANRQASET